MQVHNSWSDDGPAGHPGRPDAAPPTVGVCFVCSGNICRSPIAEVVFRHAIEQAGLCGQVVVDSAGTGDWHIGEGADHRAVTILARHGYDGSAHRARQFDPAWFAERQFVIALDSGHLRTLRSWAPSAPARDQVQLLRSFDPAVVARAAASGRPRELDVPDPYYDDLEAFAEVLDMVESASAGLLEAVRARLSAALDG